MSVRVSRAERHGLVNGLSEVNNNGVGEGIRQAHSSNVPHIITINGGKGVGWGPKQMSQGG